MLHCRCWKLKRAGRYEAQYTTPTVQRAEGVMVWAAMKANGEICLRRCPPRVNAQAYRSILESAKGFIRPRCEPKPHWDGAWLVHVTLQASWVDIPARWSPSSSGSKYDQLVAL